jgi:hypothetical protein
MIPWRVPKTALVTSAPRLQACALTGAYAGKEGQLSADLSPGTLIGRDLQQSSFEEPVPTSLSGGCRGMARRGTELRSTPSVIPQSHAGSRTAGNYNTAPKPEQRPEPEPSNHACAVIQPVPLGQGTFRRITAIMRMLQ